MQFTKLFNSILDSTIWQEPPATKLVWITLLAMSDRNGDVHASIPGLAKRAGVTLEECESALQCLSSPDKYSRTKDHEGRRIRAMDGGFTLLNHGKYRALLSAEERKEYNRKKQAEYRASKSLSKNVNDSQSLSAMSAHTEAEAEAEAKEEKNGSKEPKTRAPKQPSEQWLESLRKEPIYAHVDFDRELRKAEIWIADHPGRKLTLKFFKAWINRIEPPLNVTATKPIEISEEEIKMREALDASRAIGQIHYER